MPVFSSAVSKRVERKILYQHQRLTKPWTHTSGVPAVYLIIIFPSKMSRRFPLTVILTKIMHHGTRHDSISVLLVEEFFVPSNYITSIIEAIDRLWILLALVDEDEVLRRISQQERY